MVTIDCPFCETPLRLDGLAETVHCDECRIELEFAPDETLPVVARAA
jgi:hypothetical protein